MALDELSRRQFLTAAGAGIAASTLMPSLARAQDNSSAATSSAEHTAPVPDKEKVGWAIAGIGNFARGPILGNIDKCRYTAVRGFVTRDPDGKGRQFAEKYKVDPAAVVKLEDMDRLADRADIEVVYVITPNTLHKDYALAAIKAGKHVFCEKPFAGTEADCQEIIDAAKAAGKLVGLGYRMRFDAANIAAIDIIKKKELGQLKFITGEFGFNLNTSQPAGAWRADKELSGGGSLMDIGVYGVNAARFLTGEEPIEISGQTQSTEGDPRWKTVEETALFEFKFPSGALFQAVSSYGMSGFNRIHAMGSDGWFDLNPAIAYEGAKLHLKKKGPPQEMPFPPTNQFALEMDDFSQAIRENRPARSTGEDGLLDVRYMTAIYESAKNGGQIIKL